MADIIKCPVCGESNLPDQEFCQYCQSRLQPLTGNLKGADAPIKPGQVPTKKNTAELEPILPQWLRDARDSARKSAEDDAQAGQQSRESFSSSPSGTPDLLAGLQSHAGSDEEETPDWLSNITGAAPKPKKPQAESPEVRWVELGGAKDFAQEEPDSEPYTPSWLEGLTPTEPQREEKDELTDWFRQTDDSQKQQPEQQAQPFDTSSFSPDIQPSDDTPDWLKKMADESAQSSNDALFTESSAAPEAPSVDTPDWLRQMAADAGEMPSESNAASTDSPDWLQQLGADEDAQSGQVQTLSAGTFEAPEQKTNDAPDWLRAMGEPQEQTPGADPAVFSETAFGESDTGNISAGSLPDWMKDLSSSESDQPIQAEKPAWLKEEQTPSSTRAEVPAWLSGTPSSEEQPAEKEKDEAGFGDIPSWLKAAAPQSSIYEGTSVEATPAPASSSDSPDWLNAFKSIDTPAEPQAQTEFPSNTPFETPPAFTPDSQTGENMDALFTDMPDWLSSAASAETPPSTDPTSPPAANAETITPGELPSWVQAMRPVETGSSRSSSLSLAGGDQTLESRGALAGLKGVLPSAPGFTPTSKPKAYSIKLQASEEQLAHAALLEQILAAETEPVPIASFSALTTSRGLRWFLTAALFIAVTAALFLPAPFFPMPIGVPPEITGAIQVSQSIPDGAPVLVTFDYEPARAGEMEAAAAPIFNLLRQPNLTFVSTNETSSILAQRFITGPLADPDQSGFNVLNLGYLPGGQMGIRALAQNPQQTFPQLKDITSLSQFAALIVITDSADSARTWIEQTTSTRGTIPVVIISSAQAAPMIQPYYDSRQVSGLVSGLYGSVVSEQEAFRLNNINTPKIAPVYWDAYNLGMLLAMVLIIAGGLWNLVVALRNRTVMGETT